MTTPRYPHPFSAGRFAYSSRTLPQLGRACERREKSTIQHPRASTRQRVPQPRDSHIKTLRSSARFTETERSRASFTLIELMAATTVLSVILLMMVGMQDQMSKAWSNSNRRTDATREARAACRLMARDFSYLLIRHTNLTRQVMRSSGATNSMVPFCYYSGSGTSALSMPSSWAQGSAYLFGIVPRKKSSTDDSDFALVGYYIAQSTNTNVNGFPSVSWNLHRYYKTSNAAISAFTNWIGTNSPANLFPSINPTITATNLVADDILARNACNLQIRVLIATNSANGLISNFNYGSNSANGLYLGNKIHVELTCYPEESAQKLTDMSSWTNTKNLQKLARTFEFNVDLPENED
jgi:type II secretory pathway component PulJ